MNNDSCVLQLSRVVELPRTSQVVHDASLFPPLAEMEARRVEGEPFYATHRYRIAPPKPTTSSSRAVSGGEGLSAGEGLEHPLPVDAAVFDVGFACRCFDELPPCDAVGLLLGEDHTGLMVWEGSRRALAFLHHATVSTTPVVIDEGCSTTRKNSENEPPMSLTVVELGAGCGFLAVGFAAALAASVATASANTQAQEQPTPTASPRSLVHHVLQGVIKMRNSRREGTTHEKAGPTIRIAATDGNDECVALIAVNAALLQQVEQWRRGSSHDGPGGGNNEGQQPSVQLTTCEYLWGNPLTAPRVDQGVIISTSFSPHSTSEEAVSLAEWVQGGGDGDMLLIISGDVVYGFEAVEPLAKATADLVHAHHGASQQRPLGVGVGGTMAVWLLSWMPRCLSVAQNIRLFAALLQASSAAGWAVDTIWHFPVDGSTGGSDRIPAATEVNARIGRGASVPVEPMPCQSMPQREQRALLETIYQSPTPEGSPAVTKEQTDLIMGGCIIIFRLKH